MKDNPGTSLVSVRGEGPVDAPIERVYGVLTDYDHAPEWVEMLHTSRILRVYGPHEFLVYNHSDLPWPVTDRDTVTRRRATFDIPLRRIEIILRSEDDPIMPQQPKRIRAEVSFGRVRLTSLENNTRTQVEYEMVADPKGSIPKFLIAYGQRSWPRDTIRNLRKQVQKAHVRSNPDIARMLGL